MILSSSYNNTQGDSASYDDMDLGLSLTFPSQESPKKRQRGSDLSDGSSYSMAVPFQLELLPFAPVLPNQPSSSMRGIDVNTSPDDTDKVSSDDDSLIRRRKLRLSREQSAFLEESFKEHHTLNPKQKLALAKQLNLRPRQVEVWFQNRRARTKLKQTEVDCEYMRSCCEALTQENRRLQREVEELRALKSAHRFSTHAPATTLTICPSCERLGSINHSFTDPKSTCFVRDGL